MSVFNGEYRDFFCAMFENSKQDRYSQLWIHGFRSVTNNDVFTLISAENSKESFPYFSVPTKQIYYLCRRHVALASSKSPVIPFLICRVIHPKLYCSTTGLPHTMVLTGQLQLHLKPTSLQMAQVMTQSSLFIL